MRRSSVTLAAHNVVQSIGGVKGSRLLEFYDPSGLRRLVDRQNDLDGAASLAAVDERRLAGLDRGDEVGELAGVADVRNRRRIARAARGAALLRETRPNRVVLGRLRIEFPLQEVVLLDHGA